MTGKLGTMRKAVEWVVYPIKSDRIIVQSATRIAEFCPKTGVGRLSKSCHGGAYFTDLIFATPIQVPQEFIDLCIVNHDSIKKWAIEAKELLAKGEYGSVKVNLTMIQNQADEEIRTPMSKIDLTEGMEEDEIFPGVFICSDQDACDIHIIDSEGEVATWTFDEVCEDPQTLEAVLVAVGLAVLKGPQAVRENIKDQGATMHLVYTQTQKNFK